MVDHVWPIIVQGVFPSGKKFLPTGSPFRRESRHQNCTNFHSIACPPPIVTVFRRFPQIEREAWNSQCLKALTESLRDWSAVPGRPALFPSSEFFGAHFPAEPRGKASRRSVLEFNACGVGGMERELVFQGASTGLGGHNALAATQPGRFSERSWRKWQTRGGKINGASREVERKTLRSFTLLTSKLAHRGAAHGLPARRLVSFLRKAPGKARGGCHG